MNKKNWLWGTAFLACAISGGLLGLVYAEKTSGNHTVSISDQRMDPQKIEVDQGAQVSIHIQNSGHAPHNFVLPDYYIFTRNLSPGEKTDVGFTANKKGTFRYFSDATGSPEPGLQGILIVK